MTTQNRVPLTKNQKEILEEFYSKPHTRVTFNKSERNQIWNSFRSNRSIPALNLDARCPALLAELEKAISSGNLVQSAVFSECVYAQTLATMLGLTQFSNFGDSPNSVPQSIVNLIESYHLKPRYVYKSPRGDRMLIQAGGSAGIDSALVSVHDNNVFTIEFKEPEAKTSEPDLPAYGEDGNLVLDDRFLASNPQFETMLREQLDEGLNFWDVMGSNVNDFSPQSIQIAISENYAAKKFADVICVEDKLGFLTMIPANQVGMWSLTQGEIRPAGRNHYSVWTPQALEKFIIAAGGEISNGQVVMPEHKMGTSSPRGGTSEVSRYKVNSLFFVREEHAENVRGFVYFNIDKVKQLKPTITAKMFFTDLAVAQVERHYRSEF